MTTRTDVVFEYNSSPRVIEVASPSVEMVMQDYVDTVRVNEHSFQGMAFTKLLNASGKEDLGGGVLVGITAASQDTLLAFEGRTTPAETGTVTSNPGSPIAGRDAFIDTTATFIANNVARGSLVINFTDNSIGDVISVDSETQLTTKTLVNGIGNTYDAADVYHVFNIIQCKADGGNLTAVNPALATISPILPTAFTQIILTASSSATTSNLESLEFASFAGEVAIDPLNGTNGTAFPQGTREFPVKTIADADTVKDSRGLSRFRVLTDLTVASIDLSTAFHSFIGDNSSTTLTVDASADLTGNAFENLTLSGRMGGDNIINNCNIGVVTDVSGTINNSKFKRSLLPVITLNGALEVSDCEEGGDALIGDMPKFIVADEFLDIVAYNGTYILKNMIVGGLVAAHFVSGRLFIDSSCSAGKIVIRGNYSQPISDSSTGTVLDDQSDSLKRTEMHKTLALEAGSPKTNKNDGGFIIDDITVTGTQSGTDIIQERQ